CVIVQQFLSHVALSLREFKKSDCTKAATVNNEPLTVAALGFKGYNTTPLYNRKTPPLNTAPAFAGAGT
ncbi:TPA: hypothetical protein ACYS2P_002810, partial [Staphylococcus aureus]